MQGFKLDFSVYEWNILAIGQNEDNICTDVGKSSDPHKIQNKFKIAKESNSKESNN